MTDQLDIASIRKDFPILEQVQDGVAAAGVGLTLLIAASAGFTKTGSQSEPWIGTTLEWTTTSPPPLGNFDSQPRVTSANPVLDMNTADEVDSAEPEEVSV